MLEYTVTSPAPREVWDALVDTQAYKGWRDEPFAISLQGELIVRRHDSPLRH